MWTYEETSLVLKVWMAILALFLAVQLAPRRNRFAKWLKRHFRKLAQHPWLCCLAIVTISMSLNLMLTGIRYPLPWTHDEFSYLLAADTFAEGRLTNPTHPQWEHFETFHVLSQPSYMSKYPPGNALALACGQWLSGHAIVGVWISLALAAVAVFWMFRAWLPPVWAAVGGLLVAAHAPLLSAWGQSYWGGAVAMFGGALIFGGLRRALREPRLIDGCLLGLGLVVVANTRPLEGLLASLPVAVVLLVWLVRSPVREWRPKIARVLAPVGLIGCIGLLAMAKYNQSLTGDALTLPYKLHDETYSASSLMIWNAPPPSPAYHHERMERFYHEWGRQRQLALRDFDQYWLNLGRKFRLLWDFTPFALGICLLAIPWVWSRPWLKFALLTLSLVLIVHTQMATSWMYPHYLAPVVGLFLIVNLQGWRHLRLWQRRSRLGLVLGRAVLIFAILKLIPTVIDWNKPTRLHPRQFVERQLADQPGPHLVLVSYDADYRIVDEWVYNRADIDRAAIVWARDVGQEKNAQLIEYFANRKVWRWHLVDDENMVLTPYDARAPKLSSQTTRP